jgi:hypothetical protein
LARHQRRCEGSRISGAEWLEEPLHQCSELGADSKSIRSGAIPEEDRKAKMRELAAVDTLVVNEHPPESIAGVRSLVRREA